MLAELVEAMPEPRRSRIKKRFADAEARLKEVGLWEKFEPMGTSDLPEDEHRAISRDYFSLWLDCPFLEDEACGIHPHRPAVCREYLVTSPAENCRTPYDKPIDKLPVTAWVNVALAYVSAKVLGRRPQLITLTAALDWTLYRIFFSGSAQRMPGWKRMPVFWRAASRLRASSRMCFSMPRKLIWTCCATRRFWSWSAQVCDF